MKNIDCGFDGLLSRLGGSQIRLVYSRGNSFSAIIEVPGFFDTKLLSCIRDLSVEPLIIFFLCNCRFSTILEGYA